MSAPAMISAIRYADHLAVRLHAHTTTTAADPLNLAILLDVSDSMSGDRLNTVKRTLHAARDLFQSTDRVTLVTFGEAATTVADHLLMNAEGVATFYTAVDAIATSGCTNLSAGLERILTLQESDSPFTMTLLLTDGHVNRGVTSTVGLRTMAMGIGEAPINVFGYGADHNRILSRELAITSRGTYTYIDGDEILPIAVGDIVSGLRSEVLKRASVRVTGGWECMELGSGGSTHLIGGVAPDRDYWVVYRRRGADTDDAIAVTLTAVGVEETLVGVPITDCYDLTEQVLRCRLAKALSAASDAVERGRLICDDIAALNTEFEALPVELKARPLILRMRGQIAEIMAQMPATMYPPAGGLQRQVACYSEPPPPHLAARLSSGTAYLSTQRGVMSQAAEDPNSGMAVFSSPLQRTTSSQVRGIYASTPSPAANPSDP